MLSSDKHQQYNKQKSLGKRACGFDHDAQPGSPFIPPLHHPYLHALTNMYNSTARRAGVSFLVPWPPARELTGLAITR
jgi:hypothetical protein